jgi:GntR family transcriptional regulator, transcriptional repressor for pyruvate dehydrogenase complex
MKAPPAKLAAPLGRMSTKAQQALALRQAQDANPHDFARNPRVSDAGAFIKPVSRATLPQEIVKALTDLIMKRVWKPGDLIPSEKELALQFQVGRSTIREAVKSLVVLGVLEARAGEGSFVREPTSELLSGGFRWGLLLSEGNLDDFVDVRALIEVECARRAAANRTRELISELNMTVGDMRAEPMDHGAFRESDTRFHLAIAHAARNPIFETVGSTIQSIVRIWYPKTYYIPETKDRTLAEHIAIIDGVASGDADAAARAMRAHIMAAAQRLRTLLPPQGTRG